MTRPKNRKILYFLSIFCLLIACQCIGDGPVSDFDIYNQTGNTIVAIGKRLAPSNYVEKRQIASGRKDDFSYLFSNEKRKASYFFEYIKITTEDGTILFNLRGEALDAAFKLIKETESSITYRLDVN